MPDRGSPTLLRILPLGMAAALLLCLFPPLKARRQQQARGQAIIDSASDAIISIDSAQFILHANAAAARLFDDTPAGMRGRHLGHYILRDLRSLGRHEGDPPFGDISQELRLSAHRAAWLLAHGELPPPDKVLDHQCRHTWCVNVAPTMPPRPVVAPLDACA